MWFYEWELEGKWDEDSTLYDSVFPFVVIPMATGAKRVDVRRRCDEGT